MNRIVSQYNKKYIQQCSIAVFKIPEKYFWLKNYHVCRFSRNQIIQPAYNLLIHDFFSIKGRYTLLLKIFTINR